MDFLDNNWLALLSLVVALLGGVPGLLAAVTYFKNKPVFHYSLANLVTGELYSEKNHASRCMIFLSGTVANDGAQPFSPDRFTLEIDIDGSWVQFEPHLIPENVEFGSDVQDIQISEPWRRDLQKFSGAIGKGIPINGFLMFVSEKVSIDKLRQAVEANNKLKLTCIDIYNRNHGLTFKPNGQNISSQTTYPKHGVSVKTKI